MLTVVRRIGRGERGSRHPVGPYGREIRAAVALGLFALLCGCGGSAPGSGLRSLILAAINRTVSARTADVSLNLELGAATATGTGTINISSGELEMLMVVSAGNLGVAQIPVRFVGGTLYEAPPGLGNLEAGRSWISFADTSTEGGASPSPLARSGNPTGFFQLPSQPGADIISLGPSTVNDVPVRGYSVIFSGSALRRLATAGRLPLSDQALRYPLLTNLAETLQIDATGHVTEITQQLNIGGSSVTESLELSDYGTPTSITAPPPSSVITYQQYQHDIGNSPALLI